jgi:levansucrase
VLPHEDIWDMWPVQEQNGSPTVAAGHELWITLSAPARGHPEARHDLARLRLLAKSDDRWKDLGRVFAGDTSPGSREWSGSAVHHPDGTISIFYTAVGRRGEARPTFTQRVIEARPRLLTDRGRILLEQRVEHREVLRSDGRTYLPADEIDGAPGRIRAFRDPGWFRDPADGHEYLLVAASVAWRDRFMGAVALAARSGGWSLRPPLIVADGINHEIERPHIVVRNSSYYLFFSTQRHGFHPPGCAPTGLYGFAAPNLTGPYTPLNGSGLVIQNPSIEPDQAYAWLVLPDLRVVSFLNYRSVDETDPRRAEAAEARAAFGGTIAPVLQLTLNGTSTTVAVPRVRGRRLGTAPVRR